MLTFVRVTLLVAAVIVGFAALVLILKLLLVAAVIAVAIIGAAFLVRSLRFRLPARRRWVTTLTARR